MPYVMCRVLSDTIVDNYEHVSCQQRRAPRSTHARGISRRTESVYARHLIASDLKKRFLAKRPNRFAKVVIVNTIRSNDTILDLSEKLKLKLIPRRCIWVINLKTA